MNNKRITSDKNYKRPHNTFQDSLTKQEIKDKLKDYKKCLDISSVSIGTHIRYFTIDKLKGTKVFRLGGTLNRIDPEKRFIILSNGQLSWSVQIGNTDFWQKLSDSELKEELKEQIKKELNIIADASEEKQSNISKDNEDLKHKNKNLQEINEKLLKENKSLNKKINQLNLQLDKIASEIKNKKEKK